MKSNETNTYQIILVFAEGGGGGGWELESLEKNLSEQGREPTNSGSLLKTGRWTAQWATSSESLTVSFQSEKVLFLSRRGEKEKNNRQHNFSSKVKSLEMI